jgi:hypothetical protein
LKSIALCGWTSDRTGDQDQNTSSDETGDQISKPSTEAHAQHSEQPTGEGSADYTKQYVHQIAPHELLSQPPGYTSNNDSCYPTNVPIFHDASPSPLVTSAIGNWKLYKIRDCIANAKYNDTLFEYTE